jgi:putative endonuclease
MTQIGSFCCVYKLWINLCVLGITDTVLINILGNVHNIFSIYRLLLKAMNTANYSRKDIGSLGERIAAFFLQKNGFEIVARNVARKTGELDIVARKGETLHVVEVKTRSCEEFPESSSAKDVYAPFENLHTYKIRKVARTAQWYASDIGWGGEVQIDAVLVWIRKRDGVARVTYMPQIL